MSTLALLLFGIPAFHAEALFRYDNESAPPRLAAKVRAASCQLCHTPSRDRTERNEFGESLAAYLDKDRFPVSRTKVPGSWQREIEAAFELVEREKASDGRTFLQRLEAGELPSP
jgi:hypothetical protein